MVDESRNDSWRCIRVTTSFTCFRLRQLLIVRFSGSCFLWQRKIKVCEFTGEKPAFQLLGSYFIQTIFGIFEFNPCHHSSLVVVLLLTLYCLLLLLLKSFFRSLLSFFWIFCGRTHGWLKRKTLAISRCAHTTTFFASLKNQKLSQNIFAACGDGNGRIDRTLKMNSSTIWEFSLTFTWQFSIRFFVSTCRSIFDVVFVPFMAHFLMYSFTSFKVRKIDCHLGSFQLLLFPSPSSGFWFCFVQFLFIFRSHSYLLLNWHGSR